MKIFLETDRLTLRHFTEADEDNCKIQRRIAYLKAPKRSDPVSVPNRGSRMPV